MPIEERAKQFMPFAALRGLPEALAAKEKELEDNRSGGLRQERKSHHHDAQHHQDHARRPV